MSFQDIAPPSASEDHQLYDMDQPPAQHNMHGPGPPGGHSQGMRFHSSGPQSGNFGSFGNMDGSGAPCGPPGGRSGTMSGSDIALQWQQGHYMGANNQGVESGFVSGAGTGPPSQAGHDDLEGDGGMGFHTGPGSITGSSLYDLDTGHPSELSSLQSSVAGVQNNPDEILPRLMNQLIDEDPVVVLETQIMVEKLAKKENFFNAMIRNLDFVGSIVQSLVIAMTTLNHAANALAAANNANESGTNTPNDGSGTPQQKSLTDRLDSAEKQTRHASNILRTMTNCKDPNNKQQMDNQILACHKILEAQGIPPITALLLCHIDRIKFNAIATIHSLLLCLDQNPQAAEPTKQQLRDHGGVETMVELLKTDNVKLLTILTDCLRILATKNQHTKDVILTRNGPSILVEIMQCRHQEYKNLILMTTRLLKVLSCCPKSKRAIIEAGGMEALAGHLSSDQPKIIINCLLTMRNMSDLASGIPDGESLCQVLVNKLRYHELVIVSCATGILANLTANNETLKLAVCKANGVPELIRLIDIVPLDNKDGRDILDSALSALKHLTNNHRGAEQVQHVFIFELGGLSILNRHLTPTTSRPSLKGILNVVRNLLLKGGNHEAIKKEALPQKILQMLEWAMQGLSDSRENMPADGVRLTELVETSLSCAYSFSKEAIYNDMIRDTNIIRLFKGILLFFAHEENKGSTDNIIRLAAGIIEAVSSADLEGAYIIYREGLEEAVIRLSNHGNQKIAQFAASILHNLSNMKNQEQTGNFHPPKQLQQPHTQMQNPNLQNIPPTGGNGFGQGPGPNQQGGPSHMQPGGPPGYHPRNNFPPLQQQGPMSNNPGFDQMMGDPAMHGSGPTGQPPQMPMGQRDPQKGGGGYHQMQGTQRGPAPDGRMGGQPGFVDEMSMEMGHMNVTSPPYNPNFPDFYDGPM